LPRVPSMARKKSALEKKVRRQPKVKLDKSEFEDTEDSETEFLATAPIVVRARHLATLYVAIKRDLPGVEWVRLAKENTRSFYAFVKTAQLLDDYERASHRRINDSDYILAHLWYWGRRCYTPRLYSSTSLVLYEAYMRVVSATRVEHDPELDSQYDEDLIHYLSELRGESKTTVRKSLKYANLI
jgi:hypothetical protein